MKKQPIQLGCANAQDFLDDRLTVAIDELGIIEAYTFKPTQCSSERTDIIIEDLQQKHGINDDVIKKLGFGKVS